MNSAELQAASRSTAFHYRQRLAVRFLMPQVTKPCANQSEVANEAKVVSLQTYLKVFQNDFFLMLIVLEAICSFPPAMKDSCLCGA